MSPIIPQAERRSAQVIYPTAFRPKAKPLTITEWAQAHRALKPLPLPRPSSGGFYTTHVDYFDDFGPREGEPPLARGLALIEAGVISEALLFGAIVLPLPLVRSPLRAFVRQLAARLAR